MPACRALVVTLALALGGCDSPAENPNAGTGDFPRQVTTTLSSILLGGASVCGRDFAAAAAPVTATINAPPAAGPGPLVIELRRGTCREPGEVVAASSLGQLTQDVTPGAYFVMIANTSEETVVFILQVEYTLLPGAPAP